MKKKSELIRVSPSLRKALQEIKRESKVKTMTDASVIASYMINNYKKDLNHKPKRKDLLPDLF